MVLAGVLLWSVVKAGGAAVTLARAPGAADRTGLMTPRNRPVRATTPEFARIAAAERAVVFVYLPTCAVCHANMANWTELATDLRGGPVRVFAVAASKTPAAMDYFGPMARQVEVIAADPAEVHAAFEVRSTPSTLLVERGRIRASVEGSLTAAARRHIREFASLPTY